MPPFDDETFFGSHLAFVGPWLPQCGYLDACTVDAEPGDVLEVRIKSVELTIPFACNSFGPRGGFLPEAFPGVSRSRIVPLDMKRMIGHFSDSLGIEIPLHPFFGSMGVAPPPARGRVNSAPPDIHAGNLDNKELIVGTILYIPVHVRRAGSVTTTRSPQNTPV